VQAQNFTGFGDAHNQGSAIARGGGKFGATLAQNKNSAGILPLDQNHGVFRKNRGMFKKGAESSHAPNYKPASYKNVAYCTTSTTGCEVDVVPSVAVTVTVYCAGNNPLPVGVRMSTVPDPDFVVSATAMAVTVTVAGLGTVAGEV
jgi:hypothetical protein